MYDIEFLDANQCYISKLRNNNSVLTQLQVKEYLGPTFTEDVNFLTFSSTPYIFNYIYNEQNNSIVFYFNYAP